LKPYKILIFFISIAIVLLTIVFVFPKDGINITEDFKLYYPTYSELIGDDDTKNKSVDSLILNQLALLDEGFSDTIQEIFSDTVESLLDIPAKESTFHVDTLRTRIQKIEFSENNKTLLHKFFKKVRRAKDVVRILHYGDSQIEGDRITSFIRNRLQKRFGGYGVGLVCPKPLVKSFSINQKYSENWLRFPIFGTKEGLVEHKRYGGLGVFCRYAPAVPDSIRYDSILFANREKKIVNAEIVFSKSGSAYIKDRQIRNFSILYGNAEEHILTEIYDGDNLLFAKYMNTNTTMSKMHFRFPKVLESFTVKFSGYDSPNIYAMALDADKGVVVDNIPMRGSSGTYFNKMDLSVLKAFYSKLDLGMILLEFGGNVIPFIETDQGVKNYESWFYSQIRTLRRLNPHVPIIVMGVADMSKKEKDKYVSYSYIVQVRDAMKRAAFRAGAGYWDMYEAMGGENSMPEWVNSDPKLATDDYTHYTPRGAKMVGNMFFNALMYEYQLYQN